MEKEEKQFKVLLEILEKFHSVGILQDMMLIGSWCLYFYRLEFEKVNAFPTIRRSGLRRFYWFPEKISRN